MAVHDGMNIGPRLVDFSVDESLEETGAAVALQGLLSRSYSMMSSGVTNAGAVERAIR